MKEYHFDVPISNARSLCVGPITRTEAAVTESSFCDGIGYYLFVTDVDNPHATEVLARFASEEAARSMTETLKHFCSRASFRVA
jgi:hypothetical protein